MASWVATSQLKEPLLMPFSTSTPVTPGTRTPPPSLIHRHYLPHWVETPCPTTTTGMGTSLGAHKTDTKTGETTLVKWCFILWPPQVTGRGHKSIFWSVSKFSGVFLSFLFTPWSSMQSQLGLSKLLVAQETQSKCREFLFDTPSQQLLYSFYMYLTNLHTL